MENLKGACIIGQSGGPTAVINASAQGVIQTALASDQITRVLGAAHGIKGVLADQLYDMSQEDPAELDLLQFTPSSALGSCRYKLADPDVDDTDYQRILEIFKKYDVRYFFYNGGNDSMDTCNKISKYMQRVGYPCSIIGVPKTIDNDLDGTDHCPGFASAAKYIATSCMEVYQDAQRVRHRHGHHRGDHGPPRRLAGRRCRAGHAEPAAARTWSICPRVDFDMDQFLADVKRHLRRHRQLPGGRVRGHPLRRRHLRLRGQDLRHRRLRARPAGRSGRHAGRRGQAEDGRQGPRHRAVPAPALRLPPGLSGPTWRRPMLAGKAAVEAAVSGLTDKMVALDCTRDADGYHCQTKLHPPGPSAANTETQGPPHLDQ